MRCIVPDPQLQGLKINCKLANFWFCFTSIIFVTFTFKHTFAFAIWRYSCTEIIHLKINLKWVRLSVSCTKWHKTVSFRIYIFSYLVIIFWHLLVSFKLKNVPGLLLIEKQWSYKLHGIHLCLLLFQSFNFLFWR